MTRSEVVAFYREVVETEGLAALWALLYLRHLVHQLGELHDPEWRSCMECGAEWEVPTNGELRGGRLFYSEFCKPCQDEHYRSVQRLRRELPQWVRAA